MIETTILEINVDELFTPKELLDRFPSCGLTCRQIGYAYHTRALAGIKPSHAQTSLIYIESFVQYLEYLETVPKLKIICK
jgi:hypothetical protein